MSVARLGCVTLASASVDLGVLACNERPLQPSVTLVGLNVIAPDTMAMLGPASMTVTAERNAPSACQFVLTTEPGPTTSRKPPQEIVKVRE